LDQRIPVETIPGLEPTVVASPSSAKKSRRRQPQRGKPMQPGMAARKGGKSRARKGFGHEQGGQGGQPLRRRERAGNGAAAPLAAGAKTATRRGGKGAGKAVRRSSADRHAATAAR